MNRKAYKRSTLSAAVVSALSISAALMPGTDALGKTPNQSGTDAIIGTGRDAIIGTGRDAIIGTGALKTS